MRCTPQARSNQLTKALGGLLSRPLNEFSGVDDMSEVLVEGRLTGGSTLGTQQLLDDLAAEDHVRDAAVA